MSTRPRTTALPLAFKGDFRAIMAAFVVAALLVPLLRKPGAPIPLSATDWHLQSVEGEVS